MPDGPEETTHDEVMFYDTDVGGVVHNLAYLRMIERCRTKLASQLGFDLRAMSGSLVNLSKTKAREVSSGRLQVKASRADSRGS